MKGMNVTHYGKPTVSTSIFMFEMLGGGGKGAL